METNTSYVRFAFSPDSNYVAVAGADQTTQIMSGEQKILGNLDTGAGIPVLAWLSECRLISATSQGHVRVHEVSAEGAKKIACISIPFSIKLGSRSFSEILIKDVVAIVTSTDVVLLSVKSPWAVRRVVKLPFPLEVRCAAFHPSGTALAVGCARRSSILIVKIANELDPPQLASNLDPDVVNEIRLPTPPVCIGWSRYGEKLAIGTSAGQLGLWDVPNGSVEFSPMEVAMRAVQFLSDASVLVVTAERVMLVNIEETSIADLVQQVRPKGRSIFCQDGVLVLSGDGGLERFQLTT